MNAKEREEKAAAWMAAHVPAGGAVIVAAYYTDRSDPQTDSFGGHTGDLTIIGISSHRRDLFAEMRKAASGFPETAHLGPGLDDWRVRVVSCQDIGGNVCIWKGNGSPWHDDITQDKNGNALRFPTKAEALAHMAKVGKPKSITVDGVLCHFDWAEPECHSYENRQKYSQGHGYWLGDGYGFVSGWRVRKMHRYGDRWGSDIIDAVASGRVCIKGLEAPHFGEPEETDAGLFVVPCNRDDVPRLADVAGGPLDGLRGMLTIGETTDGVDAVSMVRERRAVARVEFPAWTPGY